MINSLKAILNKMLSKHKVRTLLSQPRIMQNQQKAILNQQKVSQERKTIKTMISIYRMSKILNPINLLHNKILFQSLNKRINLLESLKETQLLKRILLKKQRIM